MSDHDFLRYFDGEMRYLKAAAQEFAERYPEAGRRLGVDGLSLKMDESVEQLFQGFSLMMAQLRRKIDDDIPELTQPLLSQLLPVVNRTLPSLAVVELSPTNPETHLQPQTLPAGTELLSLPISSQERQRGPRCPYRTVNELVLQPFSLQSLRRHTRPDGIQALTLRFTFPQQNEPRTLNLQDIPLFINGDRVLQSQLYLTLTQQVRQVQLRYSGDPESTPFGARFTPRWQRTPHTALWPDSDSPALCGEIRPWLEYFTAPMRYFFLTLDCPQAITLPAHASHIELELALATPLPYELVIAEDALRMHCVPLINLFMLAGEPLLTQQAQLDYRLRPHRLKDGHTEIYHVDTVVEKDEEDGDHYPYIPYRHFRQKGGMLKYEDQWPTRFFHTRTWRGVGGLHETLLMLGGRTHEQLPGVKLLLELTCTNGAFPRMALEQALFDSDYTTGNLALTGRTRSVPSMPYYPPTAPLYQWHLMALLHPRALSQMISSATSLRAALSLFDWRDDENNHRRLSGIRHVDYVQAFNVATQSHGVRIRLALDETQFSGTGDARLFCELLEQFFTQYASMMRFTQLTVILTGSGTEWAWPERRSNKVLM
ncbi:type VI secretion system baseplate subunit TssF [Serratia sp. DD3]|uniref:type VI secretion system baseplate subunit TssF n=1 Tax=Serratia sp. DD3 TaxID=1410619 RepID=UPI0003C4E87A|nr:type VI secretion system baseplate subunit TssF [Serratia sp. DD3]KEY59816.1 type VI secretion protein, family [Serratia sp. DD3]